MKPRILQLLISVAWLLSTAALPCAHADESTPAQPTTAPSAEPQPNQPPPEVVIWIAELDDNRYLVREQATRRLLAAGPAALDPLLAAANGDRPEPADRAIWILQKLARSDEPTVAGPALARLVQLRGRPQIVAEAQAELARISLLVCQRNLEALGADVGSQLEPILTQATVSLVVHVRLGEKWRGKTDDLRPLAEETYHQHFCLEGQPVDDAALKLFEAKEDLAWLKLVGTRVSVAGVDSLKERRPNADVYVINQALLGVAASNHRGGVAVDSVPAGTAAAAAGIKPGDVILALDGSLLPDFDRLTAHIAQRQPGDKVQVDIQRGDAKLTLEATLGSRAGLE